MSIRGCGTCGHFLACEKEKDGMYGQGWCLWAHRRNALQDMPSWYTAPVSRVAVCDNAKCPAWVDDTFGGVAFKAAELFKGDPVKVKEYILENAHRRKEALDQYVGIIEKQTSIG